MMPINSLLPYFPDHLQREEYKMFILKEYLQYKSLNIIYNSSWGKNLIFIGGTCLRFLYDFRRFSDDLDFDIHGKHTHDDHRKMGEYVCKEFNKEGIVAELDKEKNIKEGADNMSCYINFPGMLFLQGIDKNPKKKLFLKMDAQYQNTGKYRYEPEAKLIHKFEVVRMIKAAPLCILYSMKVCAILSRAKGRDFYDMMELVKLTKPDEEFIVNRLANLKNPIKLSSSRHLKELILKNLENVDWKEKMSEVSKYLHDQKEVDKVKYFKDFIVQTW